MSGYRFHMDPIRTAVRFSLIPLRAAVQIGEAFVESGEAPEPPRSEPQAAKAPTTARRQAARKRTSPQASQKPKDLDDVALARKVETVIFRDASVPKGKISVNAAAGVVWLRGEAKNPEMIKAIAEQAAAIPEVTRVENVLHLPKTPARRPSPKRGEGPRTVQTGVTNERRTTGGEDRPLEVAEHGEGRKPAPLGTNGTAS
jgi:BON domain